MKPLIRQLALAGLLLASAGAAVAKVDVSYVQPEKLTDLPLVPWQRQQALDDLAEHFKDLGKALAPGQDLKIEVLDVDLAGREHPNRFSIDRIRVRDGRGDWPRMHLRFTLSENGKSLKSGDAQLSDKSYMSHITMYPGDERLPYEKQMIDEWWEKTIGQPNAQARR